MYNILVHLLRNEASIMAITPFLGECVDDRAVIVILPLSCNFCVRAHIWACGVCARVCVCARVRCVCVCVCVHACCICAYDAGCLLHTHWTKCGGATYPDRPAIIAVTFHGRTIYRIF